jgi:sigma-B regulation protein RsbU (phosphoserine phosphatase)
MLPLMDDQATISNVTPQQLRTILDVARALTVTTDLDELLHRIAQSTCTMLGCQRASIFLHDPKSDELWSKVAIDSDPIRVPAGSGIVGHAFRHNASVHVPDAYADSRFNADFDKRSGFVTRNLLAVPMIDWDRQPVGVLQALNKKGDFGPTDAALLGLLADQAGVALQRWKLQQSAMQTSSIRHEMHLAKRLQEAAIPNRPPPVQGLACAGWTRAASINGGDCYDLWTLPSGGLAVLMGDASGHGLPAALVISQVRALVRTLCEMEADPLRVLQRVNSRLRQDLEPGRFVTAFLGFVNRDGTIRWCSAGQAPIIFHSSQGTQVADAHMPPLGVDELNGETETTQLAAGGMLILPSDGITECFNAKGDLLGTQMVVDAVRGVPQPSPQSVVDALRQLAVNWQGKEEPADDQTVIVVQRL